MYMPELHAATAIVSTVSSFFLTAIGGSLYYRELQYCFTYLAPWMLGGGCLTAICSFGGLLSAIKIYPLGFRVHMGMNLISTFFYFTLLVLYGSKSLTHFEVSDWWMGDGSSGWSEVMTCYQSTSFCAGVGASSDGCCQQPSQCPVGSLDGDCDRWSASTFCYNCTSCMSFTVERMQSDSRLALVQLILVLVLKVAAICTDFFLVKKNQRVAQALRYADRARERAEEGLDLAERVDEILDDFDT